MGWDGEGWDRTIFGHFGNLIGDLVHEVGGGKGGRGKGEWDISR